MSSATVGANTVSYKVNALEQRVSKTGPVALVPTGAAYFVHDEAGRLLGEYDASGYPVYETAYLEAPIAVFKFTGTGAGANLASTAYNAFADQLGAVRVITRPTDQAIVWRWDQAEPFGASAANQNPNGLGTFVYNPRHPGQVFDAETGQFQNWHRDYNPRLGRYLQSDPVGLAGGINPYTYATSAPTLYVDPDGREIRIVGHIAASPAGLFVHPVAYHLALYLKPDENDCECRDLQALTVGGQPDAGKLVTRFNYPGDALAKATFSQKVTPPRGVTDCQFIRRIVAAAKAYDNAAPYSLPRLIPIPGVVDGQMGPGKFNSNSYVSGVLQAAGATPPPINLPTRPHGQAPGYANPLPIGERP